MNYSSVNNDYIKNIKKLELKKYRDETGNFLVEGKHQVEEAYKAGILKELFLLENTDFHLDVKTSIVSQNVMQYLANTVTTQNVIGLCTKVPARPIKGNVLILDGVQDPGNLGTIIRTAKSFNVDTIILSMDSVDVYNAKVIRSTEGTMFSMNMMYASLPIMISNLKKQGYTILGTNVKNGTNLKEFKKVDKYALIMGNEGNGVKKEIQDMCDTNLYIPIKAESLNVAIATAIILYELEK